MKKILFLLLNLLVTILYSQQNEIWETVNFPDSISPITINAQKEGVLFVSGENESNGGLFRSFDDGQTWERIIYDSLWGTFPPYNIIHSLDNILFIGNGSGIYRSLNDGDSFEKVYTGMYGDMKFKFSLENHLYTTGWGLTLRTIDLGNSWDTVSYHGWSKFYSDIAFGINGELFAVGGGYYPPESGFFRSMDDGESWQNIGITNIFLRSVAVNSNGTILAGGHDANNVYKSYDNGDTWINTGSILADEVETYGNDLLIVGANHETNRGCWFSEDWGVSWVNMEDDILNRKITTISISPNYTIYIRSHWLPSNPNQLFRSINPILINNRIEEVPLVKIFPNPCKSQIKISVNYANLFNEYIIINHSGKTVQVDDISGNTIDVSSLESGLYILVLISDSENVRLKFEKI